MANILTKIPLIGKIATLLTNKILRSIKPFKGSNDYWNKRYENGRDSGDGSYRKLAEFKAEILNDFVDKHTIESVIEFGCGDGNQITLSHYPHYTGFDISSTAIDLCKKIFTNDDTKCFKNLDDYNNETAELSLSLDVLYHLVEDAIFEEYMQRLFKASRKFVIIYSSNTDVNPNNQPPHVKHRKFTHWVEKQHPKWNLIDKIPNRYPFQGDSKTGSFADFYIYQQRD